MLPQAPLPTSLGMRRLAAFLKETGSTLTPAEAMNEAVDDWIARKRGQLPDVVVEPARGYRWKELFLPEGSTLRMHWHGGTFDARVQGDALIYAGRRMTPRQLTVAVAGPGYNAWRALWVLLPGLTRWQPAWRLREKAEQHARRPTLSPPEALAAAAECMSDTLRGALALVDQARSQTLQPVERRKERTPRATDGMGVYLSDD